MSGLSPEDGRWLDAAVRYATPFAGTTADNPPVGALVDDPHAHDLCAIHTDRMSVPKGWVVVRHETLRV